MLSGHLYVFFGEMSIYVDCSETEICLRFYLSTNIIFKKTRFCVKEKQKKRKKIFHFVAKNEKMRYNVNVPLFIRGGYALAI